MLTGEIVNLDNVSYGSFPTASELLELPTNLVVSFIHFVRSLRINSRDQMSKYFQSPPEDIGRLCVKCHLNPEANQSSVEHYADLRRAWQREALHGSTQDIEIDLKEVLKSARKHARSYPEDTFAKEVRHSLVATVKNVGGGIAQSQYEQMGIINYELVDEIIRNCPLEPIHSWEEAKKDVDYVRKLMIDVFPYTPVQVMAKYLFTEDKPSPCSITHYCTRYHINHPHFTCSTPIRREEQIAFAKWSGQDVKTFMTEQAEKIKSWRRYL